MNPTDWTIKGFLIPPALSPSFDPSTDAIGITLPNLSILRTNKARAIRFSTLEAICRELECQPGDLLEFEEEGEA